MRPKEEWHIIPVPAIVERNLFERARRQLEENYSLANRNKKNEYLLAGKIRCTCGRTRCGEGVLHGKHLYYRCSDRVLRFPLPPVCKERGINARIADNLVWGKIAELISSPALMSAQIARWARSRSAEAEGNRAEGKANQKEL